MCQLASTQMPGSRVGKLPSSILHCGEMVNVIHFNRQWFFNVVADRCIYKYRRNIELFGVFCYPILLYFIISRNLNWLSQCISLQIGRREVLPVRPFSLHWLDVCMTCLCRWLAGVIGGFKFNA